jgi:ribosomal protein L11 methyltransferase
VSTAVDGELAEVVAELFSRYAPTGVILENLPARKTAQSERESDSILVRAFLKADDTLQTKKRKIEEGLGYLSQILPIPNPRYRILTEEDWTESWKANYDPIPIGDRIQIHPAWLPKPATDRILIQLVPGMAFGTGTHPSTQLSLEALERVLLPDQSVIDLGCGSGILSIAAAKLGAGKVLALDIDPLAIQLTQENCLLNQVQDRVQVLVGSLASPASSGSARSQADLLLANLLAHTLEKMVSEGLAGSVKPGGILVFSGVLDIQTEPLVQLCEEHGMDLVEQLSMKDWRTLILKKNPAP